LRRRDSWFNDSNTAGVVSFLMSPMLFSPIPGITGVFSVAAEVVVVMIIHSPAIGTALCT
jgi:hypothetical protein